MKKKLILILLCLLIINICTNAQSVETKFQAAIDSIHAANPSSIGIIVHVESPTNNISWNGSSGYSSKVAHSGLEPDQPALIASNIKTYVSATILRLVEMNKLYIDQPIEPLLTTKTRNLFEQAGYNLDLISIKHLLSHTSGIQNYANQKYIDFIDNNKKYRWSRDEQLELTIKTGAPLGNPETTFNYSDANYLLLTEIIEQITKKPFYSAMRELLQYKSLGLNDTWMPTLEEKPTQTKTLVHQYWGAKNWDSYDIDISVDLYGGGGIACTTTDLANFIYQLFNDGIIKDTTTFNLIYTKIPTEDLKPSNYSFGLSSYEHLGYKAYGHGGFWGTRALYIPELKTSMTIIVLERDKKDLIKEIVDQYIRILKE